MYKHIRIVDIAVTVQIFIVILSRVLLLHVYVCRGSVAATGESLREKFRNEKNLAMIM